ncbi:MAG: hypothetical protein JXB39_02970 [Deltaproteobacteria bacterium]|nr:hypothetical protein [Deltaproteobacteria bacterium]
MPVALTCPVCGAPLPEAPSPDAPVRCPFCGTLVEHGQEAAPAAPPPPVRTPGVLPPTRARPPTRTGTWITLVALTGFIGGLTAAVAALIHRATTAESPQGVPLERLAGLATLEGDPTALAASLGLDPPDGTNLYVKVADPSLEHATLSWDEPGHAKSFTLNLGEDDPAAPAVADRLQAVLGRRLVRLEDGRLSLRTGDTFFLVSSPPEYISSHTSEDDPLGRDRLDLLWRVAIASVAGRDVVLDGQVRRVLLREGWPLAEIASLDPSIRIDTALAEIPRRFPGSVVSKAIGLTCSVAVDHPWFDDIEFRWPNQARAPLERVALGPAPQADRNRFADQAAVRACLEATLGPGVVKERDHLAGEWSASWRIQGLGDVYLGGSSLGINFGRWSDTEAGPDLEAWHRLLTALDPCGRAR